MIIQTIIEFLDKFARWNLILNSTIMAIPTELLSYQRTKPGAAISPWT